MKKSNKKHQYLMGFIFTVLAWIVYVQTTDTVGPVRTASANQVLNASSTKLPGKGLDLFAFSPDGKTLASTNANGQIVLWNVASGQARLTLPKQFVNSVSSIVFSPDGNTLASVSDNSIRLWDAASGDVRLILPVSVLVTDLAFSPDGKTLATVGQDARITLRDSQSGSTTQILTGDPNGVNAIEFSPDSKILAVGGQDAQIKLWDRATGLEQTSLPGVAGAAVIDLVFSPDGKTLAAVGQDAHITLWDSQSGSTTQVLTGDPSGVNAIAFSPDSKTLAAGGQNARIKLWDRTTGLEQTSLSGVAGVAVTGLVFSPDGKSLVSVGESEPVTLWDVSNKLPQFLTGHTDWVDKVIFSSNQKTLASVGKTGQVVVWNVMTGLEQSFFQVPALGTSSVSLGLASGNLPTNSPITNKAIAVAAGPALPNGNGQTVNEAAVSQSAISTNKKKSNHDWKGVTALAISPDGTLYGGTTKDGTVRLWTENGTERFANSRHHGAAVTGVVFSADGKRLVSVGRDTEIQIMDVANGKNGQTLLAHEHPIRTVAASPDGKYFASAGEETRVMLWDAQTGKLLKILTGQTDFINAVSFSADSSHLASAGADSRILLWDVKTGRLVQTLLGHLSEVNAVAFSKDGKFLASGSTDSQVILWDAATGQQIQSFSGHQASVRAVAFSPNGQRLVSAGEDTKIMVWDTSTRKLVNQITGSANAINGLVFDPLGNLMAGSEDGKITEWNVEKGQKQQIINVPVLPQANISGGNLEFPFAKSSRFMAGNTGYHADPTPQNSTKLELLQVFYRLIDWLIPAAEAAIPGPPGGPLLVVTSSCPTCGIFNQYYAEILRAEGLNEFAAADISTITAATLAAYDVVILASTPLTPTQATLFTNWVNGGGNLIAIRPDPQLASLLGLTANGTTLSNAYLLVDTSRAPGNGIVNQPIQFHGASDGYSLNGATSLATLYSNVSTATTNPALTLVSVGIKGGQAAAFTYDLATSIVYTRQGNPAWQAQERDGLTPIRSDDKYYGNATGDPQPDWVDLNNEVAVPQADEQQRLLANLITQMNLAKKPLPRFWYFPNGKKAVIIMTGDDHGNGGTGPRFDQFTAMSPAGCNVANWECVRGTSYIYVEPDNLSNAQAAAYTAAGFEVGLHINTNCSDFNLTTGDPQNLNTLYVQQLAAFQATYPGIPAPITQRHHCIAWSDWITGAQTELNHGMRLDTSYYFWPPSWLKDRPGNFTGSAIPMRFADLSGNLIDVYQSVSHMTDESGQTYPFTVDTLLNRALGTTGYYGAYTINAHTDLPTEQEATDTVNSALARSVPVVSSVQMLTWLDGRNNSSFGNLSWNGNTLGFTVTPGTGANGLQAMLPTHASPTSSLASLTTGSGSNPVPYTIDTIKGIEYAFFPAALGAYTATYQALPLTINTTVLPGGSVAVPYSATITAKGGTLPYTWSILSGALPAGLVLNPVTGAISGTPTASGIFNFSIKVTDSASPAGTSTQALSITVTVPANLTIWPSTALPGVVDGGPDSSAELGVKFNADTSGTITGIRFYKASTNTGTHVGNLWSSTGSLLASASFSGETASGWQQMNFSPPVAISANTVYVASYHANAGHYSFDSDYFTHTGHDNPPLHALANSVSGGDGVYAYGTTSAFPNLTYVSTNYWVDVMFIPLSSGPPPTLTTISVTPANPTILTGATQQFTATGTYSDSTTQNLTNQVTWASTSSAVATIIANSGLATGVGVGTSTISATLGGVVSTPQTIQVTSGGGTVNLALNKPAVVSSTEKSTLPAAAAFDGNATTRWSSAFSDPQWIYVDLGANYTVNRVKLKWETAYAKAFKIQASNDAVTWGDIYSTATGSGGIQDLTVTQTTARYIRMYGTVRATVYGYSLFEMEVYGTATGPAPTLSSIAVTPANPTIQVGATQPFIATGTYSDSSTQNLTTQVTWVSSLPAAATINASGLASGVSTGNTTISAASGTVSGNTTLTVNAAPLTIATTSLPAGTQGTAYSVTLAATGGSPPYSWSISGVLPTGLILNTTTGVISGTPTATGTFSFTVGMTDSSSGTATKPLSITIAVAATSIWPSTTVPGVPDSGPDSAVELGVKFQATTSGHITGIRFYKASTNTGTHVGNLWSSTGSLLASANFSGETASGWQLVTFSSPVAITANTTYVASYHTNIGHYSDDQNFFASTGVSNPPLNALASAVSGGNGVFAYGSTSIFPAGTWNTSNYWVDVVFTTP